MGGIMANWAVSFLFATNHLLWFIAALFAGAYGVAYLALRRQAALSAGKLSEKNQRLEPRPRYARRRRHSARFPLSSDHWGGDFCFGHSFDVDRLSIQSDGKGSLSVGGCLGGFLRFLLCAG